MRVVITGANGVVGRDLLFEFIKHGLSDLDPLKLVILGRSNVLSSLARRVTDAVLDDGLAYISPSGADVQRIRDYCESSIRCVEIDLDRDGLCLTQEGLALLKDAPADIFFHVAALTDLRTSRPVEHAIRRTNVAGTQRILDLASHLNVRQFCYVGSAYCCGEVKGLIRPDNVGLDRGFRNPYEASKMEAEMRVRQAAARTGMRCRYFRPSIVCGRLMEQPLGAVCSFGAFYAVPAFLMRAKLAALPPGADPYWVPARLDLRACCNASGGLNVVPADYVAKVMYQVCIQDDPGESYHVVNPAHTPYDVFITQLPRVLNVYGVKLVDCIPTDLSRLEARYYRTVGALLIRYALSDRVSFCTQSVLPVLESARLQCPPVDEGAFRRLMGYAKECNFGLGFKAASAAGADAAAAA